MRGAWIEISAKIRCISSSAGRAPMRGAWIEMVRVNHFTNIGKSRPHAGRVD